MHINADIISATLEQIAETMGDPVDIIFDALFARYPHYEEMFVMDTDGQVRGSMLETCIDCLLGVAVGDSITPGNLIEASRLTHDGFGLQAGELDRIFVIMRDVFKDTLGDKWSHETDREWTNLLAKISKIGV